MSSHPISSSQQESSSSDSGQASNPSPLYPGASSPLTQPVGGPHVVSPVLSLPSHSQFDEIVVVPSTNVYPMQTREKSGIVMPRQIPTLLLTQAVPTPVKQAIKDPEWKAAMQAEFDALQH